MAACGRLGRVGDAPAATPDRAYGNLAGDRVEEGQPLASLDPFNLEVRRDQARSNLATDQLRLEALLAGPTTADLAAAQQTVSTAQSNSPVLRTI